MFLYTPTVYMVGNEYQIVFATEDNGIAWCEVGGETYPDEKNGLMRSETKIHRCAVAMDALNAAGHYKVCYRSLAERRPYFPELGPLETAEYAFRRPDIGSDKKLIMVSDTHSRRECPIKMGGYWGDALDFLIMGGDIPAESKQPSDMMSVLEVASGITGGTHPVLYVRGNHDTRGKYALDFIDYIGTADGDTYFTFRTGDIWGIVLDCGEDKDDDSDEYGGIVCCKPFRRRQTQFLRRVLASADAEFNAPGIKRRLAFCHIPFTVDMKQSAKFDIEQDVYREWTELLNAMGVEVMFCGHMHQNFAVRSDEPRNRFGARFPVIVSGTPYPKQPKPAPGEPRPTPPQGPTSGLVITLEGNRLKAIYRDSDGNDLGEEDFTL